jgi:GDPmannose 4,6-dehydratase
MKAIIFGITGQDGSHLADLLLDKGYEVIGVYRRSSTDNTSRIKHILDNQKYNQEQRFKLVEGDITDSYSITNTFKQHANVDEVYNLAAQSHVATSFKQPALTWDITGKGCLNILQCLVDLNMLNTKFYQASSSEMFGKNYDTGSNVIGTVLKYQDENTKFMPQSPYAIAKCAAHYMVRLFREAYGLHASCGILFNHEGPRRGEQFVTRKITKWIGDFIKWKNSHTENYKYVTDIHQNTINTVRSEGFVFGPSFPKLRLGNLEAFRDWGYAGDYVEAMWAMLQQDLPDDYVICTGETHTIKEFLDVAFKHVGIEDWENYVIQDPEFYRPAEVDYLRGNSDKARKALKWQPKHSFEDLVKLMVEHDTKTDS